jgi:hypothetical protein
VRKKCTLLCLVTGGEAGVVEMGASEVRKKHALLCLVARGEACVVEMGASEARKKRALLCLVVGGEAGMVEMGCLHRGCRDFGRWARAAVACTVGLCIVK